MQSGVKLLKRLKVKNPERCIGCMSCVLACARERYGVISMDRSAIRVKTQGGIEGYFAVIACRACEDPACADSCDSKALVTKNNRLYLNEEKCTGCKKCADACLIGAIPFDESLKKPVICIHCGTCAKFCPHEVLVMEGGE